MFTNLIALSRHCNARPAAYTDLKYILLGLALAVTLGACSDVEQLRSDTIVAEPSQLSAAVSRDGKLTFSGSLNHGGSLWRITDKERLFDWNFESGGQSAFRTAMFSEDGKFLAATEQKRLGLWDTETGESIRYWQTPFNILALSIAKQYVLLGQENNYATLFDVVRGGVVGGLKHEGPVTSVSLEDRAQFALTGSVDGIARYWSMEDGRVIHQFPQASAVDFVLLSPSGNLALVAAYKGHVNLYNTDTGKVLLRLYKKNLGLTAAAFNKQETKLLIGTTREKIMLWDLKRQEAIRHWQVSHDNPWHRTAVLALAIDGGKYTAATSNGLIYKFR